MNTLSTLLFDPYHGGHHAEYVGHLLQAWHTSERSGRLIAAVPPGLPDEQPALFEGPLQDSRIEIAPLRSSALPSPGDALRRVSNANAHLLRAALEAHRPATVVAMYLDHLQLSLALGIRLPGRPRLSGILFRPSLHYNAAAGFAEHLRELRKRFLLRGMARNPHLDYVFTLDHSAIPALRQQGLEPVPLPDPVAPASPGGASREEIRSRFGIDSSRILMILFGALDERKGVVPLLDALSSLPDDNLRKMALLLTGPLVPHLKEDVSARVAALEKRGGQIATHDAFVPVEEIQPLLRAANLVLATYQRHVGSSAVLIRAAAAGRPVLSQDYGYMGAQVLQHHLGRVVDSTHPGALRQALRDAIRDPSAGFSPEAAAAFAAANTPASYARTILDHVAPLDRIPPAHG